MADFTNHELYLIGRSLEQTQDDLLHMGKRADRLDGLVVSPAELMKLRQKLVTIYAANLGDGCSVPEELKNYGIDIQPNLHVDSPCRIMRTGHRLDGKRCILERLQVVMPDRDPILVQSTEEIMELNLDPDDPRFRVRAWVVDGLMSVVEVPSDALIRCN